MCTLHKLRTDYRPSWPSGGQWFFQGTNDVPNNCFPYDSDPNLGDAGTQFTTPPDPEDDPTFDISAYDFGVYYFTYEVPGQSVRELFIDLITTCVKPAPGPYFEAPVSGCYNPENQNETISLAALLEGPPCNTSPSGTWEANTSIGDPHGANPISSDGIVTLNNSIAGSDIEWTSSGCILGNNNIINLSRTYYYKFTSDPVGFLSDPSCTNCSVEREFKVDVDLDFGVELSTPNVGTLADPIFVSSSFFRPADYIEGYYGVQIPDDSNCVTTYFGEGPDVGGCGTTPGVETSLVGGLQVFGTSSIQETEPATCGNQMTTLYYPGRLGSHGFDLASAPSGMYAFHICTEPNSDGSHPCNNCQTIYTEVGIASNTTITIFKFISGNSTSTPTQGSQITFGIDMINQENPATNITVTDLLPSGLTYVSHSISYTGTGTSTYNSVTGEWVVPDLPSGEDTTLFITATVDIGGPASITNTATITSMDQQNSGNDSSSVTINPVESTEEIDIQVTGGTTTTYEKCSSQSINFAVTNAGPDEATNIQIEFTLPSGFTYATPPFVSTGTFNTSTNIWSIPSFPASVGGTIGLSYDIDHTVAGQQQVTASLLSVDQPDTNSSNNSSTTILNELPCTTAQLATNLGPNIGQNGLQNVSYSLVINGVTFNGSLAGQTKTTTNLGGCNYVTNLVDSLNAEVATAQLTDDCADLTFFYNSYVCAGCETMSLMSLDWCGGVDWELTLSSIGGISNNISTELFVGSVNSVTYNNTGGTIDTNNGPVDALTHGLGFYCIPTTVAAFS